MILDHPSILFLWRYLALPGITWRYLALSGVTWCYLALPGIIWQDLRSWTSYFPYHSPGQDHRSWTSYSPIIPLGKTSEVNQDISPFLKEPQNYHRCLQPTTEVLQITTDASNLLQVSPVYHRISSRTLSEKFLIQPTYRNIIYHFCYLQLLLF